MQSIPARCDTQGTRRETQGDLSRYCPLIDKNTFMDDLAAGAEDENGAIKFYYELS
jgi:hypothetical protein